MILERLKFSDPGGRVEWENPKPETQRYGKKVGNFIGPKKIFFQPEAAK